MPRRLGVVPRRSVVVDFAEDPRDGCEEEGDLPPRRPSWRSLRRALRHARGPVLYGRMWWWYESDGRPVRACSTIPVAYLHTDGRTWVTDWSAVQGVQRRRAKAVEDQWEDWLPAGHSDLLDVMRLCHAGRAASRGSGRVGPLARRLLGEPSVLCDLVDDAWVIDHQRGARTEGRYRVVIGTATSRSRRVGEFAEMDAAQQAALDAVEDARRRLAARLAGQGGIAAEFAAARARWPRPSVRFVPSPE